MAELSPFFRDFFAIVVNLINILGLKCNERNERNERTNTLCGGIPVCKEMTYGLSSNVPSTFDISKNG